VSERKTSIPIVVVCGAMEEAKWANADDDSYESVVVGKGSPSDAPRQVPDPGQRRDHNVETGSSARSTKPYACADCRYTAENTLLYVSF